MPPACPAAAFLLLACLTPGTVGFGLGREPSPSFFYSLKTWLKMDEFFQYLMALHPLSDELKAALVSRSNKEHHRKSKTILSAGQFCDWIGFVESGLVKVCYDIPGGDERIISFLRAGEMVCAIKSYNKHLPSKVSMVTLDETVLRKLQKAEVEALCERLPLFNIHLRKIIEGQSSMLEDHYLLLTLPARDRLVRLEEEYRWMLQDRRIKDYMVAGYLGVDRATYSRWRHSG